MFLKHLKWKDCLIVGFTFIITVVMTSLTAIDETPCEAVVPFIISLLVFLGFILMMPVNFPIISVIHLINFIGQKELISYDWYFTVLPWLCAVVYTLAVAIVLAVYNGKRK